MEMRISAGSSHTFTAQQATPQLVIENRHNGTGTIEYLIGDILKATVEVVPNRPPIIIESLSADVTVWNYVDNAVYCIYQ